MHVRHAWTSVSSTGCAHAPTHWERTHVCACKQGEWRVVVGGRLACTARSCASTRHTAGRCQMANGSDACLTQCACRHHSECARKQACRRMPDDTNTLAICGSGAHFTPAACRQRFARTCARTRAGRTCAFCCEACAILFLYCVHTWQTPAHHACVPRFHVTTPRRFAMCLHSSSRCSSGKCSSSSTVHAAQ